MGVVGESLEIRWGTGDTLLIISRTDYYLFDLPIISCYSNFVSTSCSQLKSEKNKATRALQLNSRHTTGSRSNAVVLDQLVFPDSIVVLSIYYVAKCVSTYHWIPLQELKEGRQIGRAELYVATHTRKDGKPIDDYSDKIVCHFLSLVGFCTLVLSCSSCFVFA